MRRPIADRIPFVERGFDCRRLVVLVAGRCAIYDADRYVDEQHCDAQPERRPTGAATH